MRLKGSPSRADPERMPDQRPIDRAIFREAEDGTTVFFPWGLERRGYQLADHRARKRASRAASTLISAVIGIGTWTAYRLQPLLESEGHGLTEILGTLVAPGAALVLVIVAYWAWASRFVESLPESHLKVDREQRLREAAELVAPWKVALIGVILGGSSALLSWLQPHAWWFGLLGIALGVGALYWSHLLKRAAVAAREDQ